MPVYEYQCQRCGERFSELRPLRKADAETKCPRCQAKESRRVPSVAVAGACGPSG